MESVNMIDTSASGDACMKWSTLTNVAITGATHSTSKQSRGVIDGQGAWNIYYYYSG